MVGICFLHGRRMVCYVGSARSGRIIAHSRYMVRILLWHNPYMVGYDCNIVATWQGIAVTWIAYRVMMLLTW